MRVHEFTLASDFERDDLMDISQKASGFMSDIVIRFEYAGSEHTVDVKSLLGILLLPIKAGSPVRLETKGADELEALEHMLALFEKKLHF